MKVSRLGHRGGCRRRRLLLVLALLAATWDPIFPRAGSAPGAGPGAAKTRLLNPGRVGLSDHSFCDRQGPFLGLGASYFQALRHAKTDRARLTNNLAFLSANGFNYVRVLSMVNWDGLEIAPVTFTNRLAHRVEAWPDYWERFRELLHLASENGLRVEVTIFADAQYVMPDGGDRLRHMDGILSSIAGREHQVMHLEVANEAWQNGFSGERGVAELRDYARYLADRTEVLVAITSNDDTSERGIVALHRDSAADLATIHFSRDTRTPEGAWLPVRDCYRVGRLPGLPPVTSNEPIGPGASVASELDPIKLGSAAIYAYLAGLPGYVFHSSAGVYARDRFQDTPGVRAYRLLHALLPPDVSSWSRVDGRGDDAPFRVYCQGQPDRYWPEVNGATRGCHSCVGAVRDGEFVCLAMGILSEGVTLEARRPLEFQAFDPLTGATVTRRRLSAGERFELAQGSGAYLLRGLLC